MSARVARPMRFRLANASLLIAVIAAASVHTSESQATDARAQARADDVLRREGEAVIALADRAMSGRQPPPDFPMTWRNDFLKAQPGTFVPFTVTVDVAVRSLPGALMYVRVVSRDVGADKRRATAPYPYETIFPLEYDDVASQPVRIQRGFAIAPGHYTVYVVVRERISESRGRRDPGPKASVLVQGLDVPDFWTGELTTSTVILADRLETLSAPIPPARLEEDPYVVGSSRIYPASGTAFRRGSELVVVFLIYNPRVGTDKQFDVQVDYHLYRKNREGERYVTRTNPQRFNPSLMGPYFDPASGQPVLAGQGILLSEFEAGEYRLGITVTDLVARKTVSRDVAFSVVGS